MERKFLITVNNKLATITTAADIKEAIVDHAVANRMNPMDLDAKEIGDKTLKELFVQEVVQDKLNKDYPFHTQKDVAGVTEQILVNEGFWAVFGNDVEDEVFAYMKILRR